MKGIVVMVLIVSLMCLLPAADATPKRPVDGAKTAKPPDDIPASRLRVWSDSPGKKRLEAEFTVLRNGVVYLRLNNGKIASVALDRLSSPDRQWIRENTTTDGRFRREAGYVLPRAAFLAKQRTWEITVRTKCRPLAATLTTDDPIRIALHWSRVRYLPASHSEPAIYRRIHHSDVSSEQLDTLKSLKIHLFTPAGQQYLLKADVKDNTPGAPLWYGDCTTLFLTISEEGLSEAKHVSGKWTETRSS